MPIYEYICQDCGRKFELLRSFSQADAQTECLSCGSTEVKRLLSLVNAFSAGSSLGGQNQCGSCASGNCSNCGSH